jgi:hypothetical protein
VKIFLATWTEENQGVTLTKADCKKRLLSYFFLQSAKIKSIKTYVLKGIFKT